MSNESKPHPFIEFVSAFFEDKTKKPCADVSFSDGRVVRLYMGDAVCGSSAGPCVLDALKQTVEAIRNLQCALEGIGRKDIADLSVLAHAAGKNALRAARVVDHDRQA